MSSLSVTASADILSVSAAGDIARRIANFPIVSCDVFDTALLRMLARPEDVFLALGARARARGLISYSAEAFREYRIEAERMARAKAEAGGSDEVRLAAVYEHMQACGLLGGAATADQLASLELTVECDVCRPNESIRAAIRNLGQHQRLIFVSDTLLPGKWLEQLLRTHGYVGSFQVFSSADVGLSKHTGRLFRHVLDSLGCAPEDIVHLGDNPVSDRERPREYGITSVHLPQPPRPPEEDGLVASHHAMRLLYSHRRSLAARRARNDKDDNEKSPSLYRYGTVLLLGYTLFVLDQARKRGTQRVYFVARDGYLPYLIAQRLAPALCPDLQLTYLHASRRAMVPARMHDLDWMAREIADKLGGFKLDAALEIIDVPPDQTAEMLRAIGLDPSARIGKAAGPTEVRRLLDAQHGLFAQAMGRKRDALLLYLRQCGFLEPGPRIITDVGWRGSVQQALQTVTGLPREDIFGCYVGLWPDALREEINPENAAGYLFNFGHPRSHCDIVAEGYGVPELFFSAPEGSVTHYEMYGEVARPVLAIEEEPSASVRREFFRRIQQGCLEEIEALHTILGAAWTPIDAQSALRDVETLLARPDFKQLQALNCVPFISGMNASSIATLVNPIPFHQWILKPRQTLSRIARSPWRGGSVRGSLPRPLPSMTFRELKYRVEWLLSKV